MVELTADRLVLVENGAAVDSPGSIDDYIDFVLGRNQPKAEAKPKAIKVDRRAAANSRNEAIALKRVASDAEAESARLAAQCSAIDRAMFDPAGAEPDLASLPMSELSRRRAKLGAALALAEARWLEASEQLESLAA
jgi:ATP-binding cassette subfamily F protein 3